jgi:transcriptional regulator with XRE-family HTH domain
MNDRQVARAFGTVLREARSARKLTQEDLAAEADVDRTYPSLLERGHRLPTLGVYFRLCRALRCSPAELMVATVEGLSRFGVPAALTRDAMPLSSPISQVPDVHLPPRR